MLVITTNLSKTSFIPRKCLGMVFVLVVTSVVSLTQASGYGYDSDVDNQATVDSARRILSETGGIFVGQEVLSEHFNVSPRLPYRLPFTERDLWDCGRCVLFPGVSRIGYRKARTSITKLHRNPEARQLFIRTHSPTAPWFKDEPWANEPLRTGWHLIRLEVRGEGEPPRSQGFFEGQERPPQPNVAFWMLLFIPEHIFTGEAFFTNARTHGGKSIVTIGRPKPGAIRVHHTPRDLGNAGVGRIAEIVPNH